MGDRKQKRGAYRREECTFIGAWVPTDMVELFDDLVTRLDTDRSKLLRQALEDKLSKQEPTPQNS